jgi:hypothetical protein
VYDVLIAYLKREEPPEASQDDLIAMLKRDAEQDDDGC